MKEDQKEKETFEKLNLNPKDENSKDCNSGKLRRLVKREKHARGSHTNNKDFFNTLEAGCLLVSLCGQQITQGMKDALKKYLQKKLHELFA